MTPVQFSVLCLISENLEKLLARMPPPALVLADESANTIKELTHRLEKAESQLYKATVIAHRQLYTRVELLKALTQ